MGDFLYTSGQIALDPATGQVVPGSIAEQTTQVLENLKAILEAAGTDLSHVVKTLVFLKDMNDFAAMNAVYGKYLAPEGTVPPARSTVEAGTAAERRAGGDRGYRAAVTKSGLNFIQQRENKE